MEKEGSFGERKPPFTRDQIVAATDVVRQWRLKIEPKLQSFPYILVFSGTDPRTTIMPYEKFEAMWQAAEQVAELELESEVLSRALHTALSGSPLISLGETVQKAGISWEDLEAAPDVELEAD